MICKIIYLTGLLCFVQVYSGGSNDTSTYSNYCDCNKNYKNLAASYDSSYKEYQDYIKPLIKKYKAAISKYLEAMKLNPSCRNKYYSTNCVKEYLQTAYAVCGITMLGPEFKAPWKKNPKLSSKQYCDFLSTQGRLGLQIIKNNKSRFPKCVIDEWFEDRFYSAWKNCTLTP